MILLRQIHENDLEGLERLSKIAAEKHPGFLNMPSGSDSWRDKVTYSVSSFSQELKKSLHGKYIFVAEDTDTQQILAISMVSEQHGTPESPHFYFQVGQEQKYSETIKTGFIHGTLEFKMDTNGPTEIGGLLVDPDYRNHQDIRLGRQISFVRFLYVAMHRARFRDRILAELLPPLTKRGKSPLWEAIGRRFTNMDYWEADYLSSKNKEFILSLFPSGKIYISFLSAEARNAIGKVSKDTEPVMYMLKKVGFSYQNQVDPFDGGPHLVAQTADIEPIRKTRQYLYQGPFLESVASSGEVQLVEGLVTCPKASFFRAVAIQGQLVENQIYFPEDKADLIQVRPGYDVAFMPFY